MAAVDLKEALRERSPEQSHPVSAPKMTKKRCLYLRVKRMQDTVLSALALVILSPLMLLIALAVVIDDPQGGPIFSQLRCGRDGKTFRLYKFRTMCVGAEQRLSELLAYNEMDGPALRFRMTQELPAWGDFCGLRAWMSCPSWSTF